MGKDLNGKELGKGIGQRKDGRYEARATIKGHKICIYNFNLNELKRAFAKEKENIKKKDIVNYANISLMEWFNAWFEQYKKPMLKSTGIAPYKRKFINTYGSLLGEINLTELNQFQIQTATATLVEKKYSPKYIRDGLAVLKLMLDAAVGNYMIGQNPACGIQVPTYNETAQSNKRVLTKEEQKRFLDKIESSYYKELYHFMLSTGVRVGEMGALQWRDIDFKNGFIIITHSLSCQYVDGVKHISITTPKTRNSFRKIPFFDETKEILLKQKEKQEQLKKQLKDRWRATKELGDVDLVFTSSMGSPVTRYVLEQDMRQIMKELNNAELYNALREGREAQKIEGLFPHALRHTFATRCLERGMSVEVIQRIMGHADINVTMGYAHVLEDVIQEEAKKLGNFFIA